MKMGIGLVSLLLAGAIIGVFSTKAFSILSGPDGSKNALNQATEAKKLADLKALEERLNVFFVENDSYPKDISQIDVGGLDLGTIQYQVCSQNKVLITTEDRQTIILESGGKSNQKSC